MNAFMTGFITELVKVGFGLPEAKRVLSAAKKITLPRGSTEKLFEGTESPLASRTSASSIGRARSLTKTIEPKVRSGLIEQGISPEDIDEVLAEHDHVLKETAGAAKKTGPIITRVKKSPASALARLIRHPRPSSPESKHVLEGVLRGHELDETSVRPTVAGGLGHLSPDVMFREHNRVVTLPPEHKDVGTFMTKLRNEAGPENATWFSPFGLTYGKGQRLSRHARRHMVESLEEKTAFFHGFSDELTKLADSGGGGFGAGGVAQVDADLAKTRKEEDKATGGPKGRVGATFGQTNPDFPGQIRPGKLGTQGGGPLMADPSRWPTNRLTS